MATRKSKKTIEQAVPEKGAQAPIAAEPSDIIGVVEVVDPVADHSQGLALPAGAPLYGAASDLASASYTPEAVDTIYSAAISTGNEKGRFIDYPDSPFHLYQPYPPGGDQPRAIDLLEQGVRDGLMSQTLLGVTGSGKTFTMANVIARTGRPAIIFAPNKTLAAQLYSEFREFFPKNSPNQM